MESPQRPDAAPLDLVLAASGTTIAWAAAASAPEPCPVHLSDLASGTDLQAAAPSRGRTNNGAFSPDGRYQAVVFGGVDAAGRSKADCSIAAGHATAVLIAPDRDHRFLCVGAADGQQLASARTGEATRKP